MLAKATGRRQRSDGFDSRLHGSDISAFTQRAEGFFCFFFLSFGLTLGLWFPVIITARESECCGTGVTRRNWSERLPRMVTLGDTQCGPWRVALEPSFPWQAFPLPVLLVSHL